MSSSLVGQRSTALCGGRRFRFSSTYSLSANSNCLRFDRQRVRLADSLPRAKAGSSIAAKRAMIAMTTSSSIRVKPFRELGLTLGGISEVNLSNFNSRQGNQGFAQPEISAISIQNPALACPWDLSDRSSIQRKSANRARFYLGLVMEAIMNAESNREAGTIFSRSSHP